MVSVHLSPTSMLMYPPGAVGACLLLQAANARTVPTTVSTRISPPAELLRQRQGPMPAAVHPRPSSCSPARAVVPPPRLPALHVIFYARIQRAASRASAGARI